MKHSHTSAKSDNDECDQGIEDIFDARAQNYHLIHEKGLCGGVMITRGAASPLSLSRAHTHGIEDSHRRVKINEQSRRAGPNWC